MDGIQEPGNDSTSNNFVDDRYETLPKLDERDISDNAKRMMRAAIHLFAQQGFAGTSVREIVNAADVTNPMLYYYFDDKAGLFNTIITYLFEQMTEETLEMLEGLESLEEAVDRVILANFEACKRSPVALRFVYSVLFGPEGSAPQVELFDTRQRMIDEVTVFFEEAQEQGSFEPNADFEPGFIVEQLFALINGHLMRTLKELESYASQEARRQKIRELLTPEMASRLSSFFFNGAGTITAT
jgi:AcrR family transcriptional regulator